MGRPWLKTEAELRTVMPTELPHGWVFESWWDLLRGTRNRATARVYLNGHGTDHELRFIVWHPSKQRIPCLACGGTGRVERPKREPDGIFAGLFGNRDPDTYDQADENGLRRCLSIGCSNGTVDPVYGASNSFIRAPGLIEQHPSMRGRLGARGLATPDLKDTESVMAWVDWLYPKLLSGEVL